MSDPLGRTTTYLTEVQDEFGEIVYQLETLRIDRDELTGTQEQWNVALDIILQGANQEMQNYTQQYEEA